MKIAAKLCIGDVSFSFPQVYVFIVYSKLGSLCPKEDVEETVSDIFVLLYRNHKKIDLQKGSLKAYLSVMAKRAAMRKGEQLAAKKTSADILSDNNSAMEMWEQRQVNNDGSLSILIRHTWVPNAGKYVMELDGIEKVTDPDSGEIMDLALDALIYSPQSGEYDEQKFIDADNKYRNALDEISLESHKGRLVFTYTLDDVKPKIIESADNEFGYQITLSSFSVFVSIDRDDFAGRTDCPLTLTFMDGTEISFKNVHSGYTQILNDPDENNIGKITNSCIHETFSEPINISRIASINIDGSIIQIQ